MLFNGEFVIDQYAAAFFPNNLGKIHLTLAQPSFNLTGYSKSFFVRWV